MKKLILIAVMMIVFGGCDDASSKPNENSSREAMLSSSSKNDGVEKSSSSVDVLVKSSEIIISKDCTTGYESAGIEFDDDSVRCGRKGNAYFGLGLKDETNAISPFGFYLFSNSDAKNSKDSIWMLETDSTKFAECEKLEILNMPFPRGFCLKLFDGSTEREFVPKYVDYEARKPYGSYIIFSKHNSYKAFCNIESSDCMLLFSCVIRYSDDYAFSMMPTVVDVKRKQIGCII